jgi:hypothetical protein
VEGLEQPVAARVRLVLDQRPVDEAGDAVHHIDPVVAGNCFGGSHVEAAREYRETTEHQLLVLRQQVVRPSDRGLQGSVPLVQTPGPAL